jgi:hypothetical protein
LREAAHERAHIAAETIALEMQLEVLDGREAGAAESALRPRFERVSDRRLHRRLLCRRRRGL